MQYNYSSLPFEMQLVKAIKQDQNHLRLSNSLTYPARQIEVVRVAYF